MSNAISALKKGNEYQALVFWKYAAKMLQEDSEIDKVCYEYDEVKSFDDVVICYKKPQCFRDTQIIRDYIQIKFHVAQTKTITWEDLLSPQFVGSTKYSFMDKVVKEYRNNPLEFSQKRFILYTPWEVDQNEKTLYSLLDNIDQTIRLEVLFDQTTDRSQYGRIRKKLRESLELESDEELKAILRQVCLKCSSEKTDELKGQVSLKLQLAELKPWESSKLVYPYIALIEALSERGIKEYTANNILEYCAREELFLPVKKQRVIAIRSYLLYAENMENEVEKILDLVDCFEGRFLKKEASWKAVYDKILEFGRRLSKQEEYLIKLPTHLSIAFMAGYIFNPKSGVKVMPIQNTLQGEENWIITENSMFNQELFNIEERHGDQTSRNIAVLISISSDIEADVMEYINMGIGFKKIIICKLAHIGKDSVKNGFHAWKLTQQLNELLDGLLRRNKADLLHIFVAGPCSIMFNLGKLALSFGNIQLYEFDFQNERTGTYYPTVKIIKGGVM